MKYEDFQRKNNSSSKSLKRNLKNSIAKIHD